MCSRPTGLSSKSRCDHLALQLVHCRVLSPRGLSRQALVAPKWMVEPITRTAARVEEEIPLTLVSAVQLLRQGTFQFG